jgi:tRNA (guanine37-N1)-methyltransferase
MIFIKEHSCQNQANICENRYFTSTDKVFCSKTSKRNSSLFLYKELLMRIDIITSLPEILSSPLSHSIIKRARSKGLIELYIHDLRDYAQDKHKRTDDYAFGGEAGMVMMIEPIDLLISKLKGGRTYDEIIFTSPDGNRFDQKIANRLSVLNNLIILCGHYKGVDQRVRDHLVTCELSIGDYVMTGGELAAAVITDSVVRLIPGVLSDETSALTDSFQDGLLAPPVYTRPAEYKGWKVPDILLSGNDRLIENWRMEKSLEKTRKLRPDLYDSEDNT